MLSSNRLRLINLEFFIIDNKIMYSNLLSISNMYLKRKKWISNELIFYSLLWLRISDHITFFLLLGFYSCKKTQKFGNCKYIINLMRLRERPTKVDKLCLHGYDYRGNKRFDAGMRNSIFSYFPSWHDDSKITKWTTRLRIGTTRIKIIQW